MLEFFEGRVFLALSFLTMFNKQAYSKLKTIETLKIELELLSLILNLLSIGGSILEFVFLKLPQDNMPMREKNKFLN